MADFPDHPIYPAMKAQLLWATRGPSEALAYMVGSDYRAMPEPLAISLEMVKDAFAAWFSADSAAASAWAGEQTRSIKCEVMTVLSAETTGPHAETAKATALAILAGLKGDELEGVLRIYLNRLSSRNPPLAAQLLLQTGSIGEKQNSLGQTMRSWGSSDPKAALRFARENQLMPDYLQYIAMGWNSADPVNARAWALSLPEAERKVAAKGVFRSMWNAHPDELRKAATDLGVSDMGDFLGKSVERLMANDPEAAMTWLRAQSADDTRAELTRRAASIIARRAPDRAMDILLELGAKPDAKVAFNVAEALSFENPETATLWVEALPENSKERIAAVAGLLSPIWDNGDYDTVRAAAQRLLRAPSAVDESLYKLAEDYMPYPGKFTPARQAFMARLLQESEFKNLPAEDRQFTGTLFAEKLLSERDTNQVLDWAMKVRDPEVASGVRLVLERSIPEPTPEQRAKINGLPPVPAKVR